MSRPRVLILAEAANPEMVSVPLVGWSQYRAIAELVDAHLVTQVRNRDAIIRAGLVEGRDFTAIDSEKIARPATKFAEALSGGKGKGWTTGQALNALTYPYFERLVWRQFGERIAGKQFDIVHRITPLSPTVPSPIAGRCRAAGVPFILGPLNGGVPWPKGFDASRREEHEWLSYVRDAYKLLPGFASTRRNATAILIGSRDTLEQMPRRYHDKCFYLPENAIDPNKFQRWRTRTAGKPIKAVFLGRLVPYKGADMLLEAAVPLLRSNEIKVDILGEGPQKSQLAEIISRENIAANVSLAGWIEHSKVQDRLIDADVMAFPSIREFGGAVALEAMAVGLVPIVPAYGGLGELVTDQTGFLIPMGTRQEIIERLRGILTELAHDPQKIDAKSEPARRRARELFTWQAKAKQTLAIYQWVLDPTLPRPNFPIPMPDSAVP